MDPAAGESLRPQNEIHVCGPVGNFGEECEEHCVRTGSATRSPDSFAGDGGLRFPAEVNVDGVSDCESPPLWKSNVDQSHNRSFSLPMSPNARRQAIARGRRELLEMIKDIPESCYELSLKDLVERKPPEVDPEVIIDSSDIDVVVEKKSDERDLENPRDEPEKEEQRKNKGGKSEGKKKMVRNASVKDGNRLQKTSVFPIRLKKRSNWKVAPKPPPSDGGENHRQRRDSNTSSEINSGELTSSSNNEGASTRRRQKNRFLPSFCSWCKKKGVKVREVSSGKT